MEELKRYYRLFPELWEEYEPGELLGSGSFGDVYELRKKNDETTSTEAMKEVIIPPESMGGISEAFFQGLDVTGIKYYFEGMKEKALKEVEIMKRLSDCPNIIKVYDYILKELPEESEEYGWVLFVRMELLEPLKDRMIREKMTLFEAADLVMDLCTALEACQKEAVFHRDIKPENIFYSQISRQYKLGDFGIACYMGRATEEKGLPGTLTHMAPEVFQGGKFDYEADLYAVGMILYKMLNENRIAFLPDYPQVYSPAMRNQAITRRLSGEEVPLPSVIRHYKEHLVFNMADMKYDEVQEITLIAAKMVAADRNNRYRTPREVKQKLAEWKKKHSM